jgi:hypothetical protein
MLYTKSNTVGSDILIQNIQSKLYTALKISWGISDDVRYDSYGRVYKVSSDKGAIPEFYVGSEDYKEMIFDSTTNDVLSFFVLGDKTSYQLGIETADAGIIFKINIENIKPAITWRPDEEIKKDILENLQWLLPKIQQGKFRVEITGTETGYKNVFREFEGMTANKERGFYNDLNPFLIYRVNLNLTYDIHFTN